MNKKARSIPGRKKVRRRKKNPGDSLSQLMVLVEDSVVSRAEEQGASDGFLYLNSIVSLLLGLYARGSFSGGLRRSMDSMVRESLTAPIKPRRKSRKHIKIPKQTKSLALSRWSAESKSFSPDGEPLNSSDLVRFMLSAYGNGDIIICLKRKGERGG